MPDQSRLSRRSLLIGTALSGAAATVGQAADASAIDDAPEDHRKVVLKDTPHTRAYLALARQG